MKNFHPALLSCLSGLLLFAAWPVSSFTPLTFIAWIPLLLLAETNMTRNRFFASCLFAMLIWNGATTWWIWNSTDIGTVAAILINSLLMCLPWLAYTYFKKKGRRFGYASLLLCWMGFEYLHLNWQLSWPWLTLGNVFASHTSWIQWYEWTGVAGGSLWVIAANLVLFDILWKGGRPKPRTIVQTLALLLVPIAVSQLLIRDEQNGATANVVIVQPNVDPYDKVDLVNVEEQIAQLVTLSEQYIDANTRLVLWPETALPAMVSQDQVKEAEPYLPVFEFTNRHPELALLTGIETYQKYENSKSTQTSRLDQHDNLYYDFFNTAMSIQGNHPILFYNKSKLVPGVETLPSFLNFMAPVLEQFGGTTGGYGRSVAASVFQHPGNPFVSAPIICYESIYGAYVASYVRKGANLLAIITNDGWWGNTPGHRQHLQYARLRAIETRRWVVRSANTGISAVIDANGNILDTKPWDEAAVLKHSVPISTRTTLYVQLGDCLYQLAALLASFLLLWQCGLWLRNKFFNRSL